MQYLLTRARYRLHHSRLLQIAMLIAFWLIGEGIARLLHLPVPGGIVGLALVLGLIGSGRLSLFSIRRGAYWLLAEMLLFFIPACMALLDHREFVSLLGLKLFAVIVIGTVCVMAGTALTVDLCYRLKLRHAPE